MPTVIVLFPETVFVAVETEHVIPGTPLLLWYTETCVHDKLNFLKDKPYAKNLVHKDRMFRLQYSSAEKE